MAVIARRRLWAVVPIGLLCAGWMWFRFEQHVDVSMVESASAVLNQKLQRGELVDVYTAADDAFIRSTTFDEFALRVNAVREATGSCTFTGPVQWQAWWDGHTKIVSVVFVASCERRAAVETIRWRVSGGQAKLVELKFDRNLG